MDFLPIQVGNHCKKYDIRTVLSIPTDKIGIEGS